MTFLSTVQKQTYHIEPGENIPQREVMFEEVTYPIDWQRISDVATHKHEQPHTSGHYSLILAGTSYDILAHLIHPSDTSGTYIYEIHVAGQCFEVQVEDEHTKAVARSVRPIHTNGEEKVHAPMPGLVVQVLLKHGDTIERGQTVIVLEAMKMENTLTSPLTGIIKEVRVREGQTVNQGDVLVVIAEGTL